MRTALCLVLILPAIAVLVGAALKPVVPVLSPAAAVGKLAFSDKSLSASGHESCDSCHDPAHAFAPANSRAVQLGGPRDDLSGARTVPSVAYLKFTPAFHFNAAGDPVGGFNRDGRADTLAAQAAGPLLNPREMANADKAAVVRKLSKAGYGPDIRAAFGDMVFDDPERAFAALTAALEAYQQEAKEFAPFSSKYDAYLKRQTDLSPPEHRGLALFNDKKKGNCAACHPSTRGADGKPPLFTDFTYDNAGVPRNPAIPQTRDPAYFDLGLGGPDRTDLSGRKDLCGAFKVPTLRNVATRHAFFHNGRFATLDEVMHFYAERDTDPDKWYKGHKFDDVSADYAEAVNTDEVPYKPNADGSRRLDDQEIADIIAFLKTLTDDVHPQ
jgi:cytochrome c peroxidase